MEVEILAIRGAEMTFTQKQRRFESESCQDVLLHRLHVLVRNSVQKANIVGWNSPQGWKLWFFENLASAVSQKQNLTADKR
jgi:hypothetical protein